MRHVTILFLITVMALSSACSHSRFNERPSIANSSSQSEAPASRAAGVITGPQEQQAGYAKEDISRNQRQAQQTSESLNRASSSQTPLQAIERKIIRNGELTIELDSPEEAQRRVAAIAEKHGGFVVNSESRHNDGNQHAAPRISINVIARVPATKFVEAVAEIEQMGGSVLHRKITGQDVTEEFIDLEAQIRAKRA
ncbi:MAG: DUF4349 domain-containing protein, partial [Blastocatellia bacterium]